MSLSEEKQSEVIEAFSSTSRYLDGLLDIANKYFDDLVSQIYRSALQSNKAIFFLKLKHCFGFAFVCFRWVYFMQNL